MTAANHQDHICLTMITVGAGNADRDAFRALKRGSPAGLRAAVLNAEC